MGEFSIWHWLVVLLVVMLLFGGGKVSGLMGDLAKGIKAFKKTMAEDETPSASAPVAAPKPEALETEAAPAAPAATSPGVSPGASPGAPPGPPAAAQPAPRSPAEPVAHA